MKNSKLNLILRSLNTKEKVFLNTFVSCDYFCKEPALKRAIKHLTDLDLSTQTSDKQKLYAVIYPNQPYKDTKLRLAQSQLYKIVEQFLKIHYAVIDPELQLNTEVFLLKYYRQHRLEKLYNSQATKLKKLYADTAETSWSDHILRTKLDTEIEVYQYDSAVKRRQALNLQEILDTTDLIYYARKLKFACMALAHQTVFKQEYKLDNLKWILADINSKKLADIPLVGAYYHAYHMIKEPDNELIFQYFDSYLTEHEDQLSDEDLQTLYLFSINQCIRQLNNGNKSYGLKGLELYERALGKGVLLIDGHVSRFTYRNIAMMAIRSDDLDWAEAFTHKYAPQLQKADKHSAFNHNLALIYYYKNNYEEALTYIQEADFKDHLIHLAAKTLQAKIYYELKADQSLYSLLDSVEIYLIRNKIIGYHRNNYRNIIKFFKKLSRTNPYDKEKKQKLVEQITSEEILTEKKWLLEKLS